MDGILLVDKPKGWTSFDVVAKVRGIIRAELRKNNPAIKNIKVGHIGTLDPMATGLLVLCIGKYTKKVPELIAHDKTYDVELTLGATSTTGDQEGVITPYGDTTTILVPKLQSRTVKTVLQHFVGEQLQTPPVYSAVKVNGRRAYDLARAGKELKLEPRKVTIYSIENILYTWPKVSFICKVSSGTYIRSLAADIGTSLGCGAYMSELRRTQIAEYHIQDALLVDDLSYQNIAKSIRN